MYLAEKQKFVELRWLIPIFASEAQFILETGIENFELLEHHFAYSILNIARPPII